MRWIFLLLLGSAAFVFAGPVTERVAVPSGWEKHAAAGDHETVSLQFALKWKHSGSIEQELEKTSDPDGSSYLQHLSKNQVLHMLQPCNGAGDAVKRWLEEHKVPSNAIVSSASGDSVTVQVPVHQASKMLKTKFSVYQHTGSKTTGVRTTEYTLPSGLDDFVEYVGGATQFSSPHPIAKISPPMRSAWDVDNAGHSFASSPSYCNASSVSFDCLRKFYGSYDYRPSSSKSHIGVVGFANEVPNYADLDMFLKKERPDAYKGKGTFALITPDGAHNNQSKNAAGGEANLDIQTVEGVTWPMRTSYYLYRASWVHMAQHLLELPEDQFPSVLSVSYAQNEWSGSYKYLSRACTLFAALGLRGMSIFVSAGDQGVGGGDSSKCQKNKDFIPLFPNTCPYVTSVGATQRFSPEEVATREFATISSGGGFSYYFPRPKYQDEVVPGYLKKLGNTFHGKYNPNGRAYPDLSAQGANYEIAWHQQFDTFSGTSASTPLAASFFALLNDARFSKNKPALGFVNPLIYKRLSKDHAFNDVMKGNAVGCNHHPGYYAERGWDAVSGFGTPRFKTLLRNVVNL